MWEENDDATLLCNNKDLFPFAAKVYSTLLLANTLLYSTCKLIFTKIKSLNSEGTLRTNSSPWTATQQPHVVDCSKIYTSNEAKDFPISAWWGGGVNTKLKVLGVSWWLDQNWLFWHPLPRMHFDMHSLTFTAPQRYWFTYANTIFSIF